MKLDQINYVLEIVKLGSINKAAKSLLMTQPNLSFSVKSLEEELGFKIFNRTRKGIELTRKGSLFLEHAKSIQSSVECINFLSQEKKATIDNSMSLSISAHYVSPAFYSLMDFYKQNKDINIDFKIKQTNISQVITDVSTDTSDLGFVTIYKPQKDLIKNILTLNKLEFVPIATTKLYAYMLENHPLSNKDKVKIEELTQYPLIMLNFTAKDFLYSSLLLKAQYDNFKQKIELSDYYSLTYALNEIEGVTFTIKFPNIEPMPNVGVVKGLYKEIDIDEDIIFEFGYIKKSQQILTSTVSEFLDVFKNHINMDK